MIFSHTKKLGLAIAAGMLSLSLSFIGLMVVAVLRLATSQPSNDVALMVPSLLLPLLLAGMIGKVGLDVCFRRKMPVRWWEALFIAILGMFATFGALILDFEHCDLGTLGGTLVFAIALFTFVALLIWGPGTQSKAPVATRSY